VNYEGVSRGGLKLIYKTGWERSLRYLWSMGEEEKYDGRGLGGGDRVVWINLKR